MICRKCKKDIPEESVFCMLCGAKQTVEKGRHRRGNGLGTAYKRGNTWTAAVVIGWKAMPVGEGEPPRKTPVKRTKGGFASKRDALAFCSKLLEAVYTPVRAAPQLVSYWNTYSDGELTKLSNSKQIAYRGAWKKLAALHYRQVDQITVTELRELVAQIAPTYYTARDCKTVLTRLFELAGADGWCPKDLPSYIVLPKLDEKERQVFTDLEQAALWKLYENGDMRAAVPLLMICTGMMPGEMQRLKVSNIDLQQRTITGVGMKTKVRKATPVYFPDDVLPIVEDLIAHAQPSGYLWVRNEEKWYADYYAALAAAKCRRLEPYCCRHTTATRLAISEGIAPQTIKRLMRWSTAKMLDRYAHPDDQHTREASNTLTFQK